MRFLIAALGVLSFSAGCSKIEETCSTDTPCLSGTGSVKLCTAKDGSSCRLLASDGQVFTCASCNDCGQASQAFANWCVGGALDGFSTDVGIVPTNCIRQTALCAGSEDCEKGERCNLALSPPKCQQLYCGTQGTICKSDVDEDKLCQQTLECRDHICSLPVMPDMAKPPSGSCSRNEDCETASKPYCGRDANGTRSCRAEPKTPYGCNNVALCFGECDSASCLINSNCGDNASDHARKLAQDAASCIYAYCVVHSDCPATPSTSVSPSCEKCLRNGAARLVGQPCPNPQDDACKMTTCSVVVDACIADQ